MERSFRQEVMGAEKYKCLISENFQTLSCSLPGLPLPLPLPLPDPTICSPENRSNSLAKVLWRQGLSPMCFTLPPTNSEIQHHDPNAAVT